MIRRRLLASTLLLLLVTSAAAQQRQEPGPNTRALIAAVVNPNVSDFVGPGRLRFLRQLSAHCRDTLAVLPSNSPREETWLADEGRTTDMEKIWRLVASPEYSRARLKEAFVSCDENIGKVLAAVGDGVRTERMARF